MAVPDLIRFPFPDSRLSSNSRTAHRYLTKERQGARELGYWTAIENKLAFSGEKPLEFYMLICPPDKRRRDDDNILTAFKSTRDGIFQALCLDDSLIRRTVIERGEPEKGGAVYISLEEIEQAQTVTVRFTEAQEAYKVSVQGDEISLLETDEQFQERYKST